MRLIQITLFLFVTAIMGSKRGKRRRAKRNKQKREENKMSKERRAALQYRNTMYRPSPQHTALGIKLSLLNASNMSVLNVLKELYNSGQLHHFYLIGDDVNTSEDAIKVGAWLKENGYEWAYGHVICNLLKQETPNAFRARVAKCMNLSAYLDDDDSHNSVLRKQFKALRVRRFDNWENSVGWIRRLTSCYICPGSVREEALHIIETKGS